MEVNTPAARREEDIVAAVADLLADNGFQFIPDDRLPAMRQALRPFMVAGFYRLTTRSTPATS